MQKELQLGTICSVSIQCPYPLSGKIGGFIHTGDHTPESVASPLFEDGYALHNWLVLNGFEPVGDMFAMRYISPKITVELTCEK